MKYYKTAIFALLLFSGISAVNAQKTEFSFVTASVNANQAALALDHNPVTAWVLDIKSLKQDEDLTLTLQTPGDIKELKINTEGLTRQELQNLLTVYVTVDPMNIGTPVSYSVAGNNLFTLLFTPKYGAHIKLAFKGGVLKKPVSIKEISVTFDERPAITKTSTEVNRPWLDTKMPLEARVDSILAVMTPADKMELLREGWGIPGIPRLGIPFINKVEAIHGFSYGSGATIFSQSIALAATWDKQLAEEVAMTIGDETVSANTKECWSPVHDVAQDARWGRCEETYGEDPVLVSEIGGAWIKGYQSKGLWTTPKHFAGHGAPMGGRDSHDIGLSERELREVHLVPFRHVIETYHCQAIMMAYSDFLGVPVAKSKDLLNGILREEWGFDGFIVSDCGAVENMTSRKHYTAADKIKDRVGFKTMTEGVNGIINYTMSFSADFKLSYVGMSENLVSKKKIFSVHIKNTGNINDMGTVTLFVNGTQNEEVHHYELNPSEEKTIQFSVDSSLDINNVTFTTKYKSITETLNE